MNQLVKLDQLAKNLEWTNVHYFLTIIRETVTDTEWLVAALIHTGQTMLWCCVVFCVSVCVHISHSRASWAAHGGTAPCMDLTCSPSAFTAVQNTRTKKNTPGSLLSCPTLKRRIPPIISIHLCYFIISCDVGFNLKSQYCRLNLLSPLYHVASL